MKLPDIVKLATTKEKFLNSDDYIEFAKIFLDFAANGLQAVIISQNENHYRFFQFKEDGYFNISRPINSNLLYHFSEIEKIIIEFPKILPQSKTFQKSMLKAERYY